MAAIDNSLRQVYKMISRGDLDDAIDLITKLMPAVDDTRIRYKLFVAWADLVLNNPAKAHDIIRDLHYSITVA
jgi:hypothetical protein